MQDTAVAKGSAWHQSGGTLSGNAIVDGDYMGNKSLTGGITFGHLPFVGIPDNFTTATPAGHYVSYDFGSAHDSRVLDQYGVTDAFPIGSPAWTSTDWKRKGFLFVQRHQTNPSPSTAAWRTCAPSPSPHG